MKKISVLIAKRHTTSLSLEEEFVAALKEIAHAQNKSVNELITEIDESRKKRNLSSAVRVYILSQFQNRQS
ncbi:MAG: ribbon-helix-helix domain-containing protein [Alphaproteobacteria bacterium]|nr:ribbon-helix-helix domain-containing protein [Alphaproteobacteria bacterium]